MAEFCRRAEGMGRTFNVQRSTLNAQRKAGEGANQELRNSGEGGDEAGQGTSNIEHRTSNVERGDGNTQRSMDGAEKAAVPAWAEGPESRIENQESRIRTPILLGVGAAFDIHAGLKIDSPDWVKQAGLQWLHRLCQEPRRLWRRYLFIVPTFLVLVLAQLLGLRRYEEDV